jgi:radical SAM superfamily enzyme YgiQ (UPF0313 family)
VRKSGLTFAPEAGTQRLRDVINKNITEEEILTTCKTAFEGGYTAVKLYFMIGLPTETEEDLKGIVDLAQKVVNSYYYMENSPFGKGVQVTISCACFVPQTFTPFEFEPQDTMQTLHEKQKYCSPASNPGKSPSTGMMPPPLYRSGACARRQAVVRRAVFIYQQGYYLESWDEHFSLKAWQRHDGSVWHRPGILSLQETGGSGNLPLGSSGLRCFQGVSGPRKPACLPKYHHAQMPDAVRGVQRECFDGRVLFEYNKSVL